MRTRSRPRGFTLIELMVTIAVAGVLILLAAPSFQDMILMQRLRGVNAQIITDLQYARAEAVHRGRFVRVNLNSDATQTCYTIYTSKSVIPENCDCTQGAGLACPRLSSGLPDPDYEEIKTTTVLKSGGVTLVWPSDMGMNAFAFDYVTGGLMSSPTDEAPDPMALRTIEARVDDDRRLVNDIIQTGRPHVCAPNPQKMQVAAC